MSAKTDYAGAGVELASRGVPVLDRQDVFRSTCSMILRARTDFIGHLCCERVSFQYSPMKHSFRQASRAARVKTRAMSHEGRYLR